MISITLLALPVAFFVLAGLFGVFNVIYLFQKNAIPRVVSITHGLFAISGLGFLAYITYYYFSPAWIALVLFVFVALGGLYLFSFDIRKKSIPKPIALMHGAFAIFSLIVLLSILYFNLHV